MDGVSTRTSQFRATVAPSTRVSARHLAIHQSRLSTIDAVSHGVPWIMSLAGGFFGS
jgi:hypothetical protein